MGRKRKSTARAKKSTGDGAVSATIERWLKLAAAAQARGAIGEARTYYRKVAQKNPDQAPIWHALAGASFQLGELSEVAMALERACAIEPGNIEYLSDLGGVYLSVGDLAAAERTLRTVTNLRPDYGQAQYNLCSVLYQSGKLTEAIRELRCLILREPGFAEAHFNLGVALRDSGNWGAARRAFETASKLQPDTARSYLELARLESAAHLTNDAIRNYREYRKRGHNEPEVAVELAELLHRDGQTNAAMELLEQAEREHPLAEQPVVTRARMLYDAGKLADAETLYNVVLEQFPQVTAAAVGLSRLRRVSDASDAVLVRLHRTLEELPDNDARAEAVHFALGKVYDDLGEYERAFAHYAAGNESHAGTLTYDALAAEAETDAFITTFSAQALDDEHVAASDSSKPVLVVGMPRSGTTLTEQIIAAHESAAGAGELAFFPMLVRHLPTLTGTGGDYPACWRDMKDELAGQIIEQYLGLLYRHGADAHRVTDKMPVNYKHVGFVRALFPRAYVIICRRDPRDVALSIFFQYFRERHEYAWRLTDIAHCYVQHERLIRHWLQMDSGRTHIIDYADLVQDHERTARRLIAAIELDWDPHCLDFHQMERQVKTASNWQVRQPIYTTSVARWRAYAEHLREFTATLQRERARYGIDNGDLT